MLKAMALDFDGVICDGLNECVLVTWYGWRGGALEDFGAEGMSAIPDLFQKRFQRCRAFAKHLGQFYTAFLDGIDSVRTQAEFEALYVTVELAQIEAFVAKVNAYRAAVRERMPELWLAQHSIYPGMAAFLCEASVPLYIVTAKDAASVARILDFAGVSFVAEHIFGELRDKQAALAGIMAKERLLPEELLVIDDNVLNALSAKRAGYRSSWALWGYRVPDHSEIAEAHALSSISLEELVTGKVWERAA